MDWPSGSHASTFGGNPVSCRASLATLDLLEGGYIANAVERGEQLRRGLLRLQERHAVIGEIRGLGLMVAMDLVTDRVQLAPALRDEVVQTAFRHGLLLLGCGESAIRFCPPLCISADQVDTALGILDGVLEGLRMKKVAG
jgi:4-aminobutyrate aminotransferase